MNYLDTSALIKRFVAEKGSPLIQTIVTRKGSVATAKIAYAEVYAGLTRKHRRLWHKLKHSRTLFLLTAKRLASLAPVNAFSTMWR